MSFGRALGGAGRPGTIPRPAQLRSVQAKSGTELIKSNGDHAAAEKDRANGVWDAALGARHRKPNGEPSNRKDQNDKDGVHEDSAFECCTIVVQLAQTTNRHTFCNLHSDLKKTICSGQLFPSAILATTLLSGCALYADTTFQPYEAKNGAFEGQGGAKETIDGIDFWTSGEPLRKFKILGVINDVRVDNPITMNGLKGAVAQKAKEAGGDAVIWNGESNRHGDRASSKFAVIKYLD
ncbi:hypothetical protein [Pseudomonas sp. P1.8]|uniref:hypothetical protein n=1 Tax=Pseudomonas sp. P1.8 TaxID=1699310 RepID=UPI0012E12A57|nr:hypothetical protein [Pseudomonas sp. P1.8]